MRSKFVNTVLLNVVIGFLTSSLFGQADADRDLAFNAYRTGDYAKSAKLFKKVVSKNASDAEAWVLLGNSYIKINRVDDSIDPYEKAVNLVPSNEVFSLNLATAHMLRRDPRAEVLASNILETNPKSAVANFILGSMQYFRDNYEKAGEYAAAAVTLDPGYADAYRLLSISLVSNFAASSPVRARGPNPNKNLLKKAVEAFEKYYLSVPPDQKRDLAAQFADLKFFAEYYDGTGSLDERDSKIDPRADRDSTPLKITKKVTVIYPDSARDRGTQGVVILVISFKADGKVGPVMVVKSVDKELDESAIEGARTIRFEPATKKGAPISIVQRLEFPFFLY